MPSAAQERSSQSGRSSQESGRSSRRQKSGRSSRVEAQADARPEERSGRSSSVNEREEARPGKRTLVQERGRSSRRGRSSQVEDARPSQAEQDARPASREDARPSSREDARPSRRGRSSSEQKRTLVQGGVNARQREVDVRPLSASREFHARARDFTQRRAWRAARVRGNTPFFLLGSSSSSMVIL
ncbi:hypothetical protein LR48_Vigan09g100600 [Vigna angularis]|uniref:Uncharacterized protein n=1 Tax=Phaseolus angularis TaxID=3914 RepID=A0A0L9VBN5_PHAAN|nr:hypothetical protein LR48_Vigan09g100600 [Vigna angularis]